jgi:hypothetical protein
VAVHRYKVGDRVAIKSGSSRTQNPLGDCSIVAALPETAGALQYQVRFDGENFDRRVAEPDIDSEKPAESAAMSGERAPVVDKGPWIKSVSSKRGK